ncbi:MAG: DUF167 domain-containing protein [Pirellulaceae bacterium]|jgi:hypothetical protein|nr:DUF167 domain-containing protein [Pirellulaceae bacterium]
MIELDTTDSGVVVPVKAHASARKNEIRGIHAGALRVSVTQAPEKGKANTAIVALLAAALGVRRSQIELLSGSTHPQKKFLITDLTLAEVRSRLEQALDA